MNKLLIGLSLVSGAAVGAMAAYISSPTVSLNIVSKTSILVPTKQKTEQLNMHATITLKRSGQYEAYFFTDEKVGYNASGNYAFDYHGLSLTPTSSEKVIPEGKKLSLIEMMFSQRGMHSMEGLTIIPLSDKQMIMVAPRYSYLFSEVTP
ncbi:MULTISPECIES: hypothetical protein [Vibrio]|uniref:Uncharacterized protein n=1 Tax=Vibrio sinaloensis DSM 21326 TaxID=945550 RepID=E8M433_PHOS4|nr:hypothetical protein [Vibrio sinaloensis]EGA71216.1 hypothetical protein VISI1226_14223 [Vibrio sinaloensis DSM 21326]